MAIAGKVAITLSTENGGAWSADVTYDRLVAVKHNNNLYISRKTVANVEPPNDEFWFLALEGFGGEDVEALIERLNELSDLIQAIIDGTTQVGNAKTLDGHEAEYFVNMGDSLATSITEKAFTLSDGVYFYRLGGSYYTGNDLPTSNYAWSFSNAMVLKRNNGSLEIVLFSEAAGRIAVKSYNGSWNEWSEYATTADLANYLQLTGGMVGNASVHPFEVNSTYAYAVLSYIRFLHNGTELGRLGFNEGVPSYMTTDGFPHPLLHTGNKPSGSYTGNADTQQRRISIGGVGHVLFIHSPNGIAIVTTDCAVLIKPSETTTTNLAAFDVITSELLVATADEVLNASGVAYHYDLL